MHRASRRVPDILVSSRLPRPAVNLPAVLVRMLCFYLLVFLRARDAVCSSLFEICGCWSAARRAVAKSFFSISFFCCWATIRSVGAGAAGTLSVRISLTLHAFLKKRLHLSVVVRRDRPGPYMGGAGTASSRPRPLSWLRSDSARRTPTLVRSRNSWLCSPTSRASHG